MAKVGGRRAWLAWPSALLCAGVVAGLLWLAVPGVPGAIAFAGDMLRAGSAATAVEGAQSTPHASSSGPADCRSYYPDDLWRALTLDRRNILSQGVETPVSVAESTVAAVSPKAVRSCAWKSDGGRLVTTFATVTPSAADVVRAALGTQGFACGDVHDGVRCTITSPEADEEIEIRGTDWTATRYEGWHPPEYGTALSTHVRE